MALTYDTPLILNVSSDPNKDDLKSGSDKLNAALDEIKGKLGTAAFEDTTDDRYDTDPNHLLKVDNFGLVVTQNGNELFDNDFNTIVPHAVNVTTTTAWVNGPLGDTTHTGTLYQSAPRSINNVMVQRWIPQQAAGATHKVYERTIREGVSPEDWPAWVEMLHTGNLTLDAESVTYDDTGSDIEADNVQEALDLKVSKNSDEGAAIVPAGNAASRPDVAPSVGAWLRYNSEFGTWEGSPDGVNWTGLGGAVGGAGNPAFYENDNVISADYEITTGRNAMSAGPVTINDGVTVTIPDGSTWVVV